MVLSHIWVRISFILVTHELNIENSCPRENILNEITPKRSLMVHGDYSYNFKTIILIKGRDP
jgi:hypothetical protein